MFFQGLAGSIEQARRRELETSWKGERRKWEQAQSVSGERWKGKREKGSKNTPLDPAFLNN